MRKFVLCEKHNIEHEEGSGCFYCMVEGLEKRLPEPLRTWVEKLNKELKERIIGP